MTVLKSTEEFRAKAISDAKGDVRGNANARLGFASEFASASELKICLDWRGLFDYEESLAHQHSCVDKVRKSRNQVFLIGQEHLPTISLGRRASVTHDVFYSQEELIANNWKIITSERGGQATLHSPGQLVIYPILSLNELGFSLREYVLFLEKVTIHILEEYGVQSQIGTEPGIFTSRGKIGFLGLRIVDGITYHGLALNICNELEYFRGIKSCGLLNPCLDKLECHMPGIKPEMVYQKWVANFRNSLIDRGLVLR